MVDLSVVSGRVQNAINHSVDGVVADQTSRIRCWTNRIKVVQPHVGDVYMGIRVENLTIVVGLTPMDHVHFARNVINDAHINDTLNHKRGY